MKCATHACDANGTVHFTLVEERGEVTYRVLCREHAQQSLDTLRVKHPPSQNKDAEPMRVIVEMIVYDETLVLGYVILREAEGFRRLRIETGAHECGFLDALLRAKPIRRPLTHHAFANAISSLGGHITEVIIDDFDETSRVYFAKLVVLRRDTGQETLVDLRPSDGVALAIVCNVAIVLSEVIVAGAQAGRWWI
jgi:bifunctional DNase/RNase